MEAFEIEGLAGNKTLSGEIPVRGAKNAVLKAMAASLLFSDEVHIGNVPNISDVTKMKELLEDLGAIITWEKIERTLSINAVGAKKARLDTGVAQAMRASVVLTGPLLARFGHVTFPHPGGDVIGARPLDLFFTSFEKMGAAVRVENGMYEIVAKDGLLGADIFLDIPSVGATETIMMAATLADGTTIIANAAQEPEITSLAEYLNACGAKIEGMGTSTLRITGGSHLFSDGIPYETIPDRLEAGSFIVLGVLAADEITVTGCNPAHLGSLFSLLDHAGVDIDIHDTSVTVRGATPKAIRVRTGPYPTFATDLQAPMMVLLTQAEGESQVFETLFEGRLHYTDDLVKMGANITMFDPHRVLVRGPTKLYGRVLEGPDIRAGLAYVLAAIVADGASIINNVGHIDRGYECIEDRLSALGVSINRK